MSLFERASGITITGGQFSVIHGGGQNPDVEALSTIRKIAENDASFNEYSSTEGTLKLPTITKDLLINITNIVTDNDNRPASGSCCFDLAWRLGLLPLPGQPNSGLAEYEQDIPIAKVVIRNTCCCGRVSRHGLVHLVSRFFQHVSTQETSVGGTIITVNTTIGRFRFYETDDRTFVHFDGSTRSPPITELVESQDLDHILRVSRGQYLMMDGTELRNTEWRTDAEGRIPKWTSSNFLRVPSAIMYMSKEKVAIWRLLRSFGDLLATCTLQYIDKDLREPRSFCALVQQQLSQNFDPTASKRETAAELLAFDIYLARVMSKKVVAQLEYELVSKIIQDGLLHCFRAHQHYRSPRVEVDKLFEKSQERFLRMFANYREHENSIMPSSRGRQDMETRVESELQSLMGTTTNNIALVAYQVFLGLTVYWNAARMLARSREVPTDWIRFVSAEDDYIYLG